MELLIYSNSGYFSFYTRMVIFGALRVEDFVFDIKNLIENCIKNRALG